MDTDTPAVVDVPLEQGQEVTQVEPNDQAPAPEESPDSFTSADLAALPEELQTLAKQLQGDYTRKTQALADVRHKAEAFDDLVGNPGFVAMMDNIEKYGSPVPPAAPPEEPKMTGEQLLLKMIEDPDFFWNEVDRRAEEKTRSFITPITEREAISETNAEVARLSGVYPDFTAHADEIAQMMEQSNYTLDPEAAYKLVTYDKVKTIGREEGARITETRVKTAQTTADRTPVQAKLNNPTMAEAYAAAKKALGV